MYKGKIICINLAFSEISQTYGMASIFLHGKQASQKEAFEAI